MAIDDFMERFEEIAKKRKAPKGKFRVLGVDKFDGEDWIEGNYKTLDKALRIARDKTDDARRYASDSSIATVYYVYDDKGNYRGP